MVESISEYFYNQEFVTRSSSVRPCMTEVQVRDYLGKKGGFVRGESWVDSQL